MATVEPTAEPDDVGGVAPVRDPELIAREIEQTRGELADSIDAIADRVRPQNILSEYGPQIAKVGAAVGAFFLLLMILRRLRSR